MDEIRFLLLFSNIFTDEVPRRIIVGLLEHKAFIGNKSKSPFNLNIMMFNQLKLLPMEENIQQPLMILIMLEKIMPRLPS